MQWHIDRVNILYMRMHTLTHTSWLISWTFVINSHSRLMFVTYSLSKPQTCLFLLSQNSKHPLSKDFFCLSCLSFFLHAFRSPTNELNTEKTWKRLDEAWLFVMILYLMITGIYINRNKERRKETSYKVCSIQHLWSWMCESNLVIDDQCCWQPPTSSLSFFCFSRVGLAPPLACTFPLSSGNSKAK